MTDIEEPADEFVELHVVKAAVAPPHTLIGTAERTARWTLRVCLAGRIDDPKFHHWTGSKGHPFSSIDSVYSNN